MSKNKWYLNRFKNADPNPNSKKGPLMKPPYHVHPELEDELKENKKKTDQAYKWAQSSYWTSVNTRNENGHGAKITALEEKADKQRTDHNYHFTHANGLLKKTEKALKDKLDALDAREKKNHDNENWHFTNPNGHLKKSEKLLLDKINALDARVKKLEKP